MPYAMRRGLQQRTHSNGVLKDVRNEMPGTNGGGCAVLAARTVNYVRWYVVAHVMTFNAHRRRRGSGSLDGWV